jgi:hypothetical protein
MTYYLLLATKNIIIVGRLVAAALEAEEESPGNTEHHTS